MTPTPTAPYLLDPLANRLLTADQEVELGRLARAGDSESRATIIRSNLRLVGRIALGYAGRGLDLDDLIGHGIVGLCLAADRFDADLGHRFSTYASAWIKQTIGRAIANEAALVRSPANLHTVAARWRRTAARLASESGHAPDDRAIGAAMGLAGRKLANAAESIAAHEVASRSRAPVRDGDAALALAEITAGPACDPAADLEAAEDREQTAATVAALLATLDPRSAQVLRLRYGLDGGEPMTHREIGARIGRSYGLADMIEKQAIRALRRRAERKGGESRTEPEPMEANR